MNPAWRTLLFRRRRDSQSHMKFLACCFGCFAATLAGAAADLTIMQKVEGGGPVGEVKLEIKGTKARIEGAGTVTIVDSQSGETVTILEAQKKIVRMSADKAKAAGDMVAKFAGTKAAPEKPKLIATGRKEVVNGMQTEVFTADTQFGEATYYVAADYPDGEAILQQLQQMQPLAFAGVSNFMPDYRDFHGIPVRTEIDIMGQHLITTVTSIKRDPIPETDFVVPRGYAEVQMPNILGGKSGAAAPRKP